MTKWAPTQVELDACVECGLCLPHCPTFRLTGDEAASPRGRLNAMAAVAGGEVDLDATFAELMSACLQCRACEAACPSLVPFGRAMEGARAETVAQGYGGSRIRRRVAGRWVSDRRRVRLAGFGAAVAQRIGSWIVPGRLRTSFRGLRRLPFRRSTVMGYRSEGHETIGLLAGCVMDPWFARVHEATIALFEHAGFGVVVPESQTCCGALAAHEGMATEASSMAMLNEVAFEGVDHVVANAAGCSAHLTGYEHWGAPSIAVRSVDAIALVADAIESGRLGRVSDERGPVAVHDPCHHRHAQGVHTETRDVLHAAGYELRDLDPSGMCCGAAGMYSLARPGAADALGANKAAQFAATGCDIVASGNPGCEMQLRSHITERVRVAHPLELYAEALGLLAIPRSG